MSQGLFSANTGLLVDDSEVQFLFAAAPRATFKWMRDWMGRIFGSHRREWLERTAVRVGVSGGANFDRSGFYGGLFGRARSFRYVIEPSQQAIPDHPDLSQIRASVFTDSRAALGLELGGTWRNVHGKRFLAIPLKRARNSLGKKKRPYQTPETARAAGKTFFSFRAKRTGKLYLAELIAKGAGKNKRFAFKPTYLLVREVHQKPVLRFLQTWKELEAGRMQRLEEAKQKILQEVKKG